MNCVVSHALYFHCRLHQHFLFLPLIFFLIPDSPKTVVEIPDLSGIIYDG